MRDGQDIMQEYAPKVAKVLRAANTGGETIYQLFDDFLVTALLTFSEVAAAKLRQVASLGEEDIAELVGKYLPGPDGIEAVRMLDRYSPYQKDKLAEALALLMASAVEGWADVVGETYQLLEIGNPHAGQYFTPWPVAQFMAQSLGIGATVEQRVKEALTHPDNAWGQAATLCSVLMRSKAEAWDYFTGTLIPAAAPYYKPVTVNDPACGSGIMFLAAAASMPAAYTQQGLVQFSGTDIDQTCVLMARLNMALYGLNGKGLFYAMMESDEALQTLAPQLLERYRQAKAAREAGEAEAVAAIEVDLRKLKNEQLTQLQIF